LLYYEWLRGGKISYQCWVYLLSTLRDSGLCATWKGSGISSYSQEFSPRGKIADQIDTARNQWDQWFLSSERALKKEKKR
jgi:hypothetical protein